MEQQADQVVRAILVASDPTQASLHQQALEYLSNIQQRAGETWSLALNLFVDATPSGERKHPTEARFFALRVLDDFLETRCVLRIHYPMCDRPAVAPSTVAFVDGLTPHSQDLFIRFSFHLHSDLEIMARSEPLDEKSFDTLRQTFLAYIQSEYTYGSAESNALCA